MEYILDLLKAGDRKQRRSPNMLWLFYVNKYCNCKYCSFFCTSELYYLAPQDTAHEIEVGETGAATT